MRRNIVKEKLFINGKWIETDTTHKNIINTQANFFLRFVQQMRNQQIKAVEAAVYAHKNTLFLPEHRYTVLMRTAELLLENGEEFAKIVAQEGGKPITDAKVEVTVDPW